MGDSSLWRALQVSASGMSAERMRMHTVAENIANADSTRPLENGLPYARQRVVFRTVLDEAGRNAGVQAQVIESPKYAAKHDPDHPDADPVSGLVTRADIDPVLELTDMMVATRAYQANANAARGLVRMYETTISTLGEV